MSYLTTKIIHTIKINNRLNYFDDWHLNVNKCHKNIKLIEWKHMITKFDNIPDLMNVLIISEKFNTTPIVTNESQININDNTTKYNFGLIFYDNNKKSIISKVQFNKFPSYFILNNNLYFVTNDGIFSYFPQIIQHVVFNNNNPNDLHNIVLLDKYVLIYYNYKLDTAKYQKSLEIYDLEFHKLHTLLNTELTCACNNNILVLRNINDTSLQYYDVNKNLFIDNGYFIKWFDDNTSVEFDFTTKELHLKKFMHSTCENECVLCHDALSKHIALVPCGHTQFHINCVKTFAITKCPICDTNVETYINIYM